MKWTFSRTSDHLLPFLLFNLEIYFVLFLQTFPMGLGDGQLYTWTDGLKRKDWHDYESIQKDAMRSGGSLQVN